MNGPDRPPSQPARSQPIDRHRWCIRCLFTAGLLTHTLGVSWSAAGDQQALLIDGNTASGRISGRHPAELQFFAAGTNRPYALTAIRQINFRSPPRLVSGITPPRRIFLRGDESLHAEVDSPDADTVSFTGWGATSRALPRAALRGVAQAAGERSVVYEDFEAVSTVFKNARLTTDECRSGRQSLALRPGDGPLEWSLPRPIAAGRVEFSFYDDGVRDRRSDWVAEFEFGNADRALRVSFSPGWSSDEYRVWTTGDLSLSAGRLDRSTGWRRLTLLFDSRRVMALVDEAVAASGSGKLSPLSALVFRTTVAEKPVIPGFTPTDPVASIDDLQIAQRVSEHVRPDNTQRSDLVRLANGDELFGTLENFGPHGATLAGAFGRRQFRWPQLSGIDFAFGGSSAGRPVAGLVATIELAPILYADESGSDRIVAAIQSASDSELVADHPILGLLRLPTREVQHVAPVFNGTWHLIDAAYHHLGDEIREDFHSRLAEGSRAEWKFTLPILPQGKAWVWPDETAEIGGNWGCQEIKNLLRTFVCVFGMGIQSEGAQQ